MRFRWSTKYTRILAAGALAWGGDGATKALATRATTAAIPVAAPTHCQRGSSSTSTSTGKGSSGGGGGSVVKVARGVGPNPEFMAATPPRGGAGLKHQQSAAGQNLARRRTPPNAIS